MPEQHMTADAGQAALYRALADGEHRSGPRGTIAFAVSTDDVDAGAGDLYVALGLAKYLQRLGWGVCTWPTDRWDTAVPEDVTVVVSMIESFVPGLVPAQTPVVAWVRNWTEVWAGLPYLDQFDAVWASSSAARDRVAESYTGPTRVLPIGVDLELFTGRRPDPDVGRIDVLTTVNFWGAERSGTAAIDVLAESREVVWYGANREHLPRSARIDHRGRASFFELPAVYAAASVVVDDVIPPARAYATHNSRLYEGLASGALVVTNCADGLEELGLADVPTYTDGPSLVAAVGDVDHSLVDRLRAVVVERHSYASRAAAADTDLRTVVDEHRAQPRPDRGPLLVWATHLQERLRKAEHDRDVHMAGVHDINERLLSALAAVEDGGRTIAARTVERDAAIAERDLLATRLDEVTRSRAYRLAHRLGELRRRG